MVEADLQLLKKGLDFTAIVSLSGSMFNQLVDEADLGDSFGLVVTTTDTALDTPDVPNPDGTYGDQTPTWLTRCIWKRILFGSTDVKTYVWNEGVENDTPALLHWEEQEAEAAAALALATTADTNAGNAVITANDALVTADAAVTAAAAAQADADAAKASADALAVQLSSLGAVPAGFCAPCAWYRTFSKAVNEGWLYCDGSDVLLSVFPNLAPMVGIWGAASEGSVKLPDMRAMTVAGAGPGSYTPESTALSSRTLGLTGIVGKEGVKLTAAQNGPHQHFVANTDVADNLNNTVDETEYVEVESDRGTGDADYDLQGSATEATVGLTSKSPNTAEAEAHNNMQPTLFMHYYIKT